MSSLEEIGALLGFVAFVGLAVLVFLTFQQARHLRRLRDWAGRAPERAAAAEPVDEAETEGPTAEDAPDDEPPPREPRFAGLRGSISERWEEVDRRLPVEPKLLFGGLAAIILGIGIATSGFGLVGGDEAPAGTEKQGKSKKDDSGGEPTSEKEKKPKVAVLNGTAPEAGIPGVSGIADRVSADVRQAGFRIGAVDNAGSYTASVVMFEPGAEKDAETLAEAVAPLLGTTSLVEMPADVQAIAGGAPVALIVGQDDSGI